jgi:hypothetical protein
MNKKYFKSKKSDLVVEWVKNNEIGGFEGYVVVADKNWEVGQFSNWFSFVGLKPITFLKEEEPKVSYVNPANPHQELPQPEPTPTKDLELRLECLKLAIQANCVDPVIVAKEYYEWITKPQ